MNAPILTPMLVQYLVGLCCLRWDPNAIDITLGDMVLDPAAGKERDVDVTVTIEESQEVTRAFKAYEVKRERTALDVADVEQLCLKLLDMPAVAHRAIVSASGFTEGAQAKAARHGVELYALRPWLRPLQEQFPTLTMQGLPQECFPSSQTLLCWIQPKFGLVAPEAGSDFTVNTEDVLFDAEGRPHAKYANFLAYQQELLLRSTEVLFTLEPAMTVFRTFPTLQGAGEGNPAVGPAWPHTHTLDVARDSAHVNVGGKFVKLETITINGHLQWQRSDETPMYYVVERVSDGDAFAGALITMEKRAGHMTGLIFSPKSREVGVHFVRLAEKHKNAIRRLKLDLPTSTAEP